MTEINGMCAEENQLQVKKPALHWLHTLLGTGPPGICVLKSS